MTQFSLLDEPWILVRRPGGTGDEVSLRTAFADASEIVEIVGEVPTQVFALMRLLLAIAHRAIAEEEADPIELWAHLWNTTEELGTRVEHYLAYQRSRFFLFDDEMPFYQVAGLETSSGEASSLDKLIADVPNGLPFFTTRLKSGVESLTFAEAARWLVHAQSFDPSGIKSGAIDDPRIKRGKGYPIGTAWAGSLGGILVQGRNLRETLLLNMVLADTARQPLAAGDAADLAVWERAPLTGAEEVVGGRMPTGPVDLFTWPSRRIRLIRSGTSVTQVVLTNGDALKAQLVPGIHRIEPHSVWRRSETQEKALGRTGVYMPLTHQPDRALWRGLSALLPHGVREKQISEGSKSLPPMSLEWLVTLRDEAALPGSYSTATRAIGMEYGPQSATIAEIIDDAIAVDSSVLSMKEPRLRLIAVDAVGEAEAAVSALATLARNLAVARGGNADSASDRARQEAYFLLDSPFRRWLAELTATTRTADAHAAWRHAARIVLLGIANNLIDSAGPAAWVGRLNPRTEKLINSSESFGWFLRDLSTILPTGATNSANDPPENEKATVTI